MMILLTMPAAIALLWARARHRPFDARGPAAIGLALFFPANVHAAIEHVPMGGHAWGPVYLMLRAPVQLAILAWVYWFTIRPASCSIRPSNIRKLAVSNLSPRRTGDNA